MNEIIETFFWAFVLYLAFKGFSALEKQFVKSPVERPLIIERSSLVVLRKVRLVSCFNAGVEMSFFNLSTFIIEQLIVAFCLLFIGLSRRILAIIALKEYWSYHIAVYPSQKRIKTGIYLYIRHPAYLGNVYIIGLFLLFGANYTAAMSFMLLVVFYKYRVNIEERILQCL